MDPAESADTAKGFIRALYGDEERIAVLAVDRKPPADGERDSVHQRIAPAGHVRADRFQRWLRHLNAQGYDIFVGMNPIRPGTKGREKGDIAEVRRLQLDLDANGPESLRRVLADASAERLPTPAIVVRSSKDRYQVLWNTAAGWSPAQAEDTMARLAQQYDGDHVHDIARAMRLPGFRNKKDSRDDASIRWTDYGGPPVDRSAFEHLPARMSHPGSPARRHRPRGPAPLSQSERDWAEVRDQLRQGADPAQVTAALEQRRQDKPNPHYYAERTVRRAAESLGREEPSHRNTAARERRSRPSSAPASYRNSASLAEPGDRRLPMQFRSDWSGPGR